MSRFTDYNDLASDASASGEALVLARRVDLLSPGGDLLATTQRSEVVGDVLAWAPIMAPLEVDPDRTLSRTVSIELRGTGSTFVPSRPGDLLHPETGNLVRIQQGVVANGSTTLWTKATLLCAEVEASYEQGQVTVSFDAVDPARPLRANLVDPVGWAANEPTEDVVARLVEGLADVEVQPTGFTMPAAGSFSPGRQVFELVQQLLGSCGHELTADPNGRLYSREIPPTVATGAERWSYGAEGGGLPVQRATRRWTALSPQGVIVEGGSLLSEGSTFAVQVWDTDPDSQGFYEGPGEVQVETLTYDHVDTPSQMVVAGYGRLRRIGAGPAQVDIEVAPNPAMEEGDMVQLWLPELNAPNGLYRVQRFAMPDRASGLQTVELRGVWDPQLNYGDPADPGTVCIVAADDNFDRDDQNLEDLADSPGSPRWTEHRYSWAVIDREAIQRHNNTWSLATWNTPFCSMDHICYATIGKVPSGKYIGPAIRSSGQYDCYTAMVDINGRVTLEVWQGGSRVETLGSYSTGDEPRGNTLAIEAIGSSITVYWEGDVIITASDSRRTGTFVGMHAKGGTQGSTAPSIQSWSAEVTG